MVFVGLVISPPPLIQYSLRVEWPSCVVNLLHLLVASFFFILDYAAHEVPLLLFGLGHDWACTFRGAPLPHCGQA
jgi:hypothetical protein